ncbi:hypothetical protein TNCV_104441 [Trichonephila clavipes]|nr:hypothetical protein TNCV_104441 [Trichonephila clavipes]
MAMSRWMLGEQQRAWLSITQMKVGLPLVVLTSTSPESPEIKPFKIWTPTNQLVQIASLNISCPTLDFWVGKDCYTYVTCQRKLANYQDSENRPSLFPHSLTQQECRSYDKLSSHFSYLHHLQINGMHGAAPF